MSAEITRPLLAETVEDANTINFPVLATPKLDGIRCIKVGGHALSRKFKLIPNEYIRNILENVLPDGIDGEIMLKETSDFNTIQSAVMRKSGEPDFVFNAFDYVKDDMNKSYEERIKDLVEWKNSLQLRSDINPIISDRIQVLIPVTINNVQELAELENRYLADGFEGVMIRSPQGRYKCGRSTVREGILLKIKQFRDAEAVVLDFEERLHNTNEQEVNELGLAKRSSKKEGMVGGNTLGNLKVRDIETNLEFHIGSGFDDLLRKQIWEDRESFRGLIVKYKYQPVGVKELPRFPVFLGFRHPDDMGVPETKKTQNELDV